MNVIRNEYFFVQVQLEYGEVQTESMQTLDGLQLNDPEIYRFGCISCGLQKSIWNPTGMFVGV